MANYPRCAVVDHGLSSSALQSTPVPPRAECVRGVTTAR